MGEPAGASSTPVAPGVGVTRTARATRRGSAGSAGTGGATSPRATSPRATSRGAAPRWGTAAISDLCASPDVARAIDSGAPRKLARYVSGPATRPDRTPVIDDVTSTVRTSAVGRILGAAISRASHALPRFTRSPRATPAGAAGGRGLANVESTAAGSITPSGSRPVEAGWASARAAPESVAESREPLPRSGISTVVCAATGIPAACSTDSGGTSGRCSNGRPADPLGVAVARAGVVGRDGAARSGAAACGSRLVWASGAGPGSDGGGALSTVTEVGNRAITSTEDAGRRYVTDDPTSAERRTGSVVLDRSYRPGFGASP